MRITGAALDFVDDDGPFVTAPPASLVVGAGVVIMPEVGATTLPLPPEIVKETAPSLAETPGGL